MPTKPLSLVSSTSTSESSSNEDALASIRLLATQISHVVDTLEVKEQSSGRSHGANALQPDTLVQLEQNGPEFDAILARIDVAMQKASKILDRAAVAYHTSLDSGNSSVSASRKTEYVGSSTFVAIHSCKSRSFICFHSFSRTKQQNEQSFAPYLLSIELASRCFHA